MGQEIKVVKVGLDYWKAVYSMLIQSAAVYCEKVADSYLRLIKF